MRSSTRRISGHISPPSTTRARARKHSARPRWRRSTGAEVLDCPVGFERHAFVLTEAGYVVTGLDRSEAQLAEAEQRRGDADWPRLVRGDYRSLPFPEASFDAVFNLFTSLGYLDREGERPPDDSFFLQEHELDRVAGTVSHHHLVVTPSGERIERRLVHRVYTVNL
jgi:hypothetical protein